MELTRKYENLINYLKSLEGICIAFSGGVDSTFLLKVAYEALGDKVMAVTATSSTYPERELKEAINFAAQLGVKHEIIESEELDIEGFSENPVNRCYFCKKELFTKIIKIAERNDIMYVADGSNIDDLGDYRPGMDAIKELGVISPLRHTELTKEQIRLLSRKLEIPTWDKPSFACLSSRFPYGHKITSEKLTMVDKAEEFLLSKGLRQVRVRHHGDIARIEVSAHERIRFYNEEFMDDVYKVLKKIGFMYVTLDLMGYRTGSMNEVLDK